MMAPAFGETVHWKVLRLLLMANLYSQEEKYCQTLLGLL